MCNSTTTRQTLSDHEDHTESSRTANKHLGQNKSSQLIKLHPLMVVWCSSKPPNSYEIILEILLNAQFKTGPSSMFMKCFLFSHKTLTAARFYPIIILSNYWSRVEDMFTEVQSLTALYTCRTTWGLSMSDIWTSSLSQLVNIQTWIKCIDTKVESI